MEYDPYAAGAMNILVLGSGGMLGHVVCLLLRRELGADVLAAARGDTGLSEIDRRLIRLDLTDRAALTRVIAEHRPCLVVNCAAVLPSAKSSEEHLLLVNASLPQAIAGELDLIPDGSRLIQISSDGVFSGLTGGYSEDSRPDPADPYGRSKLLGEISRPPHLTIRASIIGPELRHKRSLLEWFLGSSGTVPGYRRVLWNGVTTLQLARFIRQACAGGYSGLLHYGGQTLSKYELLLEIGRVFGHTARVIADDSRALDRTLISVRTDIPCAIPEMPEMLEELKSWYRALNPKWR